MSDTLLTRIWSTHLRVVSNIGVARSADGVNKCLAWDLYKRSKLLTNNSLGEKCNSELRIGWELQSWSLSENYLFLWCFGYSSAENDIKTKCGGPAGRGQSIYSFHQYFIWQGGGRGIVGQEKGPQHTCVVGVCKEHTPGTNKWA